MKRILLLFVLSLTLGQLTVNAQTKEFAKEGKTAIKEHKLVVKERKELAKLTEKQFKGQMLKEGKKQAKQLKREGWKSAPGTLPVENQLSEYYIKLNELDGRFPKYVIGRGSAKAATYGMARKQALARARVDIAASLQAEVASLNEMSEGNTELSNGEVETMAKMMETSQTLVQQSIGRTDVVYEIFREVDGKTEVQVAVSYDGNAAKETLMKLFDENDAQLRAKLQRMLEQK